MLLLLVEGRIRPLTLLEELSVRLKHELLQVLAALHCDFLDLAGAVEKVVVVRGDGSFHDVLQGLILRHVAPDLLLQLAFADLLRQLVLNLGPGRSVLRQHVLEVVGVVDGLARELRVAVAGLLRRLLLVQTRHRRLDRLTVGLKVLRGNSAR